MVLAIRVLTLSLGLAAASLPAAAQQTVRKPAEVTPEAFAVFSATMASARRQALSARADAYALMWPDEQARTQPRYADLAGPSLLAESAAGSGVEAAFTAPADGSAEAAIRSVRQRLAAQGATNERTARTAPDQARWREPPRHDEKGYYFSYAQTRSYRASRYADRIGLYTSAYYELLRCRSATPVGLLGGNPAWRRTWSWRVCPDAQGRYRPTL